LGVYFTVLVDKGYHNGGNCPLSNITTIVAHPTPGSEKSQPGLVGNLLMQENDN
jgi:hypothetical protein